MQLEVQTRSPQSSWGLHALVEPGVQPLDPLHAPNALHAPHAQPAATSQLRVRVCVPEPQLPHACESVSVCPGVHTPLPPPTHVLHDVQLPHWQVAASHVRERVCVPVLHVPHAWSPLSVIPATQTPSPEHDHAPHVQSAWQVRICVPHIPHVPPRSMSPGEQGPPPAHRPESVHTPAVHTCCCIPQCMHAIVRGGSPTVQSHEVGAVHIAHTPSAQRSTPAPQLELQLRSDIVPTAALASSQSVAAGTPSWSRSSVAGWHTPSTQVSPVRHAGSHTTAASSPGLLVSARVPPSPRGFTPVPLAQPTPHSASARTRAARDIEATED